MVSADRQRKGLCFFGGCIIASALSACGGGGSGGGAAAGTPSNTRPAQVGTPTNTRGFTPGTPTRTAIPTATPKVTPGTPTRTPTGGGVGTPTPTPTTVELIVRAGGNIAAAARRAPSGATIIVSPGSYAAVVLEAGQLKGPITLLADGDGSLTGSAPGTVTITGTDRSAAMSLSGQVDLTVDGFTLKGGTDAGLLVSDSSGLVVLDCTVTRSGGDGIRFERTDTSLIFNNLVYGNAGTGISLLGTDVMEVVSNTVYGSTNSGIFVGPGDTASGSVFLENNILNKNMTSGITVDSAALDGYAGDFDLNTDGYGTDTPAGDNDINDPILGAPDPQFIDAQGGDFHLSQTSPAVDAGDFDTPEDQSSFLETLTTQSDGTPDSLPVDIGFHYPLPPPTPTPRR